MSKRNSNKGRLAPFVPLLIETLDSPAWKAMSMGARVLYAALKRRYRINIHNNGRIFLSQRDAVEEIGSHRDQVARWYRELEHYGFIVMVSGWCLGVDGKGKAPHWRLTELGYMKDPPTRDFMRWKPGDFFTDEKQNPGPENRSRVARKTRPPLARKTRPVSRTGGPENQAIETNPGGPENQAISRDTTHSAQDGTLAKLTWTTPTVTEMPYTASLRRLYCEQIAA